MHHLNLLHSGQHLHLCCSQGEILASGIEIPDGVSNALGLTTSTELKLVQRIGAITNHTLGQYADTFTGWDALLGSLITFSLVLVTSL